MDEIKQPGLWLEEELTDQESQDVIKLSEIIAKYGKITPDDEKQTEKFFTEVSPFMNSFVHFFYRIIKESSSLKATENGVLLGEEGKYFDIIGYATDFVGSKVFSPNDQELQVQLPSITSVFPKDYVFPTALEATTIFSGKIKPADGEITDMDVMRIKAGTKGKGKNKTILENGIGISFNSLEKSHHIKIDHLEPEDEPIHNALLSLWLAGNTFISVPMIYRAMTKDPKRKPTEESAQMIIDSIERMRKTDIVYDNSEAAAAFGQEQHRVQANLIYAMTHNGTSDAMTGRINENAVLIKGKLVEFYVVLPSSSAFPLFDWADEKNQIQRYAMDLLPSDINKNRTTIVLESALLKRISAIGSISNTIVYDNFFESARLLEKPDGTCYTPASLRVKKSKLKSYTRRILDSWVKTGFIKSYKENISGNSAVSVTIITQKKTE